MITVKCPCGNTFAAVYRVHEPFCDNCLAANMRHVTTLQQANGRISLERAAKAEVERFGDNLGNYQTNSMTVYEPFNQVNVKLVRASKSSRWYVYGSGKRQLPIAALFGDNSNIIYVSE